MSSPYVGVKSIHVKMWRGKKIKTKENTQLQKAELSRERTLDDHYNHLRLNNRRGIAVLTTSNWHNDSQVWKNYVVFFEIII